MLDINDYYLNRNVHNNRNDNNELLENNYLNEITNNYNRLPTEDGSDLITDDRSPSSLSPRFLNTNLNLYFARISYT